MVFDKSVVVPTWPLSSVVERPVYIRQVGGSIPSAATGVLLTRVITPFPSQSFHLMRYNTFLTRFVLAKLAKVVTARV